MPLRVEGPTWTMRGVPAGRCDLLTAIGAPGASVTAWSSSAARHRGRCGGDRLRPVPGQPCAAAAASVGPASEGRERSCRPATARPRDPGRLRPVFPAVYSPSADRACSRSLAPAVRRGAPKVRP